MLNEQTATLPPDTLTAPGDLSVVEAESSETNDQLRQLQMLSQSPLSLEEALEQEAAVAVEVEEVPATATGLMLRFAAQLALFVGVGLIAASVVHHASDPKLYALLALGGGVLFASGSVASAKQATQDGIIAAVIYGAASLFLGLGVGLLVGGLLHYSAAPHQSTVTIPLGLVVAIAALFARDGRGLIGKEVVPTAITIVGLLVWLSIGLGVGAKKLDPPATPGTPAAGQAAPTDGHGAATADEHGAASTGDHGAATTGAKAAADDAHASPASGDHGAAATGDHGTAAAGGDHGAAKTAAADTHGAAASSADHAAKPAAAAAGSHEAATADEHATSTEASHAAPAEDAHAAGH